MDLPLPRGEQDSQRGTITGVAFRNCTVTGKPVSLSHFQGYDAEHAVRDVAIDNLRINGQAIRDLNDARVGVGPHVENVRVTGS